jgi:serine/threonine protein kinase
MSTPNSSELGTVFSLAALHSAAKPGGFAIPGYTILEEVAQGGMGAVYRARQLRPEREVVLKVVLPHLVERTDMLRRFQIEARAMAALDHPGVLPVYEVGEADGMPYFSMKLAVGGSLWQRLQSGPLAPREAATIMVQLARTLHFAHQHGVLHRDLKPANFLFVEDGRVCISDFGLAKLTEVSPEETAALTKTSAFFGTPDYMPPEIAGGAFSSATVAGDLYSLGVVLYECLTGKRPHREKDSVAALLRAIVDEPIAPPQSLVPSLPKDLCIVCIKALEKNAVDRYASAGEFADDLQRWLDGKQIQARPMGPLELVWRWAQQHPLSTGLSAALLVVTLTGAVAVVVSYRERGVALHEARQRLHRSLIDQARAARLLGESGHRVRALDLLRQAAAVAPSPEIRDEAIALLARPDLSPAETFSASTSSREKKSYANPVMALRETADGLYQLRFHESGAATLHRRNDTEPLHSWNSQPGRAVIGDFLANASALVLAETDQGIVWQSLDANRTARVLRPPGPLVSFLAIDPSGRRIALGREDGLEVLHLATNETLWHSGSAPVRCAPAWADDGSRLAVAPGEHREVLLLSANGELLATISAKGWPLSVAFQPHGTLLAVSTDDGTVILYDRESATAWTTLRAAARDLAFSADGSALSVTMATGARQSWSIAEPATCRELRGLPTGRLEGAVSGMKLSPDGKRLLSTAASGIAIWSLTENRQLAFHAVENQRIDVRTSAWWLSDSDVLLQVPGALERLHLDDQGQPGTPERVPRPPGSSVLEVQTDSSWLVSVVDEDGNTSIELWPGGHASAATPGSYAAPAQETITATHAASNQTATVNPSGVIVWSRDSETLRLTPPMRPDIRALLFSPDGSRLLMMTNQHHLFSWDLPALIRALKIEGL